MQLGDDSSARVPKHIPGAGASSIRIWASWSNWHQDLFASSTPFSRFYKAQCSRWLAANSQAVREEDQVWPMPLPYRRFAGKGICDRERGFRRLLNLQVSYLNFLHLGGRSPPSGICGPMPLSSKQKEVVARLRRLSEAWSLLDELHAADMGRTAAKQEKQEQVLGCLTKMCTAAVGDLKKYRLQRSCVTQGHEKDDLGQVIGKMNFGDSVAAQLLLHLELRWMADHVLILPRFLTKNLTSFLSNLFIKIYIKNVTVCIHLACRFMHPQPRK